MGDFAPSDTRLLYSLRRAHLAIEAEKQERLRDLDLLPAHYALLINVWAHPGATGAALARHVGVTPQNIANLVAKLERRGLVVRSPHARHGHVLEVRLTERGSDLLEAADRRVAEIEADVAATVGPERAAEVSEALARIAMNVLESHQPVATLPETKEESCDSTD